MQPKTSIVPVYLLAAAVTSAYMVSRNLESQKWFALLASWLVFFAFPLLFVFAYPRHLFAYSPEKKRHRFAIILNVLGAATAIFLSTGLALPYPDNPVRDADSLAFLIVPLIALPVFLVAALSLVCKKRSSLATVGSLLVWPYFFFLALGTLDRFFYESPLHRVFYFLCFFSPTLFAFAAGAVPYRSTITHATAALGGLASLPWIYWSELRSSELANPWIMFNVPDKEIGMYHPLHAGLTILAVALIVLATVTAILRLLPPQWQLRKSPVPARTWPAYAASFLSLAVWFTQSVMPYRIPGAVDYADSPILQILHVEKRGLQFHETSISVSHRYSFSFSVSGDDRRLFQYRFQQNRASGRLPPALMQRVLAMVKSPDYAKRESTIIKPLRAWNADGWYFLVEGSDIHSYNTEEGTTPPQEIVALFDDLEVEPRSPVTQSELKDVCLGFCYDPISGLGFLYSNHRCVNAGHGTHCR